MKSVLDKLSESMPRDRHRFATRASDGCLVDALTEVKRNGEKYWCCCPEKHPLIPKKPSGLPNKRGITPHFSHCAGTKCICGCGESEEHIAGKCAISETFKNPGHVIIVIEEVCHECKKCIKYSTFDSETYIVVLEMVSKDKKWRYDAVLVRRSDRTPVQVIEVVVTHYSSQEKLESTRADGLGIAEIMAEAIFANVKQGGTTWCLQHQCLKKDRKLCEECECCARLKQEEALKQEELRKQYEARKREEMRRQAELRRQEDERKQAEMRKQWQEEEEARNARKQEKGRKREDVPADEDFWARRKRENEELRRRHAAIDPYHRVP
jgi:hypothetical protein